MCERCRSESRAALEVRVLFLDVDGVLHPAMCGIQLQKALSTEDFLLRSEKALKIFKRQLKRM